MKFKCHPPQVNCWCIALLTPRARPCSPIPTLTPTPYRPVTVTATATFALRGQRRVAAKRPSGPQGLKCLLSPPKTCRPSSERGVLVPAGAQGRCWVPGAVGKRGAVGCSGLGPCLTQGPHAHPTITATSQESPPQTQEDTDAAWTQGQEGGARRKPSASGRKTESSPGRGHPRSPGPPGKQGLQRGTGVGAHHGYSPWSGP